MDMRMTERWVVERHAERVREAERVARLFPARRPARRRGLSVWAARRLRSMADRLDNRPALEVVRPVGQ